MAEFVSDGRNIHCECCAFAASFCNLSLFQTDTSRSAENRGLALTEKQLTVAVGHADTGCNNRFEVVTTDV